MSPTLVASTSGPATRVVRVLIAEDRESDVLPLRRALTQAFAVLDTLAIGDLDTLRLALQNGDWEVILVAAENRRCSPDAIIGMLREEESAMPVIVLDAPGAPPGTGDRLVAAGYQRIPRDAPARLVEAVERALRATASGRGRRVTDTDPA